jgi:hypothetical protein
MDQFVLEHVSGSGDMNLIALALFYMPESVWRYCPLVQLSSARASRRVAGSDAWRIAPPRKLCLMQPSFAAGPPGEVPALRFADEPFGGWPRLTT